MCVQPPLSVRYELCQTSAYLTGRFGPCVEAGLTVENLRRLDEWAAADWRFWCTDPP